MIKLKGNGFVLLNLKLREQYRSNFKRIAHDRGTTMQRILEAFVDAYVTDPDRFQIETNIKLKMDGKT